MESIFTSDVQRETPENVLGVLKSAIVLINDADMIFEADREEVDRRTEAMLKSKDAEVSKILMQIVKDLQGAVALRESERTMEITRMSSEFDSKIGQYQGLLNDANNKTQGLQDEMANRSKAWAKDREDLENQVKKAKQDGSDRLSQAQRVWENRMKEAQCKAEKAMDSAVAKYNKEVLGLNETLRAEQKLKEQREKETAAMKQERVEIIAMWRDKCDKQAEDAKRDLTKRMDIAEEHLQKVKAQLEGQLAQARDDIGGLKGALAKKEKEFKEAMEAEMQAEDMTLAELAAVKEARDALLAEKERQIRELHEVIELKIMEMQDLNALHKKVMDEKDLAHAVVLRERTAGFEARLAEMAAELAAVIALWDSKVAGLNQRIAQMERDHFKAMLMSREAFDADITTIKAQYQKQVADLQGVLDRTRAALEAEKEQHLADVARAVEEGLAAVLVQDQTDKDILAKVKNDFLAFIANLEQQKAIMENDLLSKIARLEEKIEKLKKDNAERLAGMEKHYNDLLKSQESEAEQHLERLLSQIETLQNALNTEKEERKKQMTLLNSINEEILKKKDAEIANILAANKAAIDELNLAWERKLKAAKDDFNRKLNARAKQLEKVKQDDERTIAGLRLEMAELLAAAEAMLLVRIAEDDLTMAAMRLEFKTKVEALEIRLAEEAVAAILILELKDKELIDAKTVWLLEVAKLKEEYELMIQNELGAEHALQAEVDRLKKKLQQALDNAAADKGKLQGEMREQAGKAAATDKAIIADCEAKLQRLRDENADKLAAERERAKNALADRDEKFRKLQVDDQVKSEQKAQELAQARAQAKKDMERIAAEGLAALTALEIELTEKLHQRDERMAEMEKKSLMELAAEKEKHEKDQQEWYTFIRQKEQTWAKELEVLESTLNAQIADLQKANENLRADLAALIAAYELEMAALVTAHNLKVAAIEKLAFEALEAMIREKDEARALWVAVQKDIAAIELDYKNKLSKLQQEMERALAALALAKDLEMETISKEARILVEERQKDCDRRVQKIRSDAKDKEATLRHKIDELHQQIRDNAEKFATEKESNRKAFDRQLEAVQEKCQKNMDAIKEACAIEVLALQSVFEAKLSKCEAARKEDLATLELASQQKITQALEQEKKYKKWLDDEMAVDAALKEERDMMKSAMGKLQAESDKNSSIASYQADKDARKLKETMQEKQKEFDAKVLAIEIEYALRLEEAIKNNAEMWQAKELDFLAKVAFITEQMQMWEAKHDQLMRNHEVFIITIEEEHRQKVEAEKAIILQQLQALQLQLEKLKKERNQALSDKDKTCSDMRQEYELMLDGKDQKMQDEIAAIRSQALKDLHAKDDEVKAVTASMREKLNDKDAELARLKKKSEEVLQKKEANLLDLIAQCEAKLEALRIRVEKKEADLAASFAEKTKALELAAAEKEHANRKALEVQERELKDYETRTNMKYASLAKEASMLKDRTVAKDKEIADALNRIEHDEKIKEKELRMLEARLIADSEAKVNRYEAALRDLEAAKLRELEVVKQDLIALKVKELLELRIILECKIKEAEQAKIIAVSEAVTIIMADKVALIMEKEKLEASFARLEAETAQVMQKELTAEAHLENKANRALKAAASDKMKYEADIKAVKHELEVSEAQKQRMREDQAASLEKVKLTSSLQVETAEKEFSLKIRQERIHNLAKDKELQERLKAKDREILVIQTEVATLTDTLVREGIDETIEIDIEIDVIEEVVIVERTIIEK